MYHIERLGNGQLRFLKGESIQPLKNRFDVFLSQQFLCIFLFGESAQSNFCKCYRGHT